MEPRYFSHGCTRHAAPKRPSRVPLRFEKGLAHESMQSENELQNELLPVTVSSVDKGLNVLEISSKFLPQGILVTVVSEVWKFLWTRLMTELAPQSKMGAYVRPSYNFTFPSSAAGSSDGGLIVDASKRYRVYVGNPCPWCHRVLLTILVLQLQEDIEVVTLQDNPRKASRGGWILHPAPDVHGNMDLRDVYNFFYDNGSFTGRCTAPLLVDTKQRQIVSNESADIVRLLIQFCERKQQQQLPMELNKIADDENYHVSAPPLMDLLPTALQSEIDAMNDWIYRLINNGVYRCGFSTTQYGYDIACQDVREGLRRCEAQLQSTQAYMCGAHFTEVDLRLLPTVLRFDGVYGPLFRAGGSHIRIKSDFPALQQWLVQCWTTIPGVRESIDLPDACASYYRQLFPLNPSGIVPFPVSAQELGLEE
jgi:glutathionyl-hydroquinone reductase